MSAQATFTIIIPALNEEKYLPQLLTDLTKQTTSDFKVIVVDGNSDDETVKKVKEFEQQLDLKVIISKKRNVSHQRNIGGKKATSEWIIFMDADNRLPPYFIDGIKYQLAKNQDVDIFACWMDASREPNQVRLSAMMFNLSMELYHKSGKPFAPGALIGVRKEILSKIKFDEKQKVTEDVVFINQAINKGYRFELFHEPRYDFSFRRFKKEGTLKMIKTLAVINLRFLLNKDFVDDNYGYVMKGGGYYDLESAPPLQKLQDFLVNSSNKQFKLARKMLTKIRHEFEELIDTF